jgi:hypothetical protein
MADLRTRWCRAALLTIACVGVAGAADRGVRFDSPGVLDLARRTTPPADVRQAVAFDTLVASDVDAILGATTLVDDSASRFSVSFDEFGCRDGVATCMATQEAKRIAQSGDAVKRIGDRLVVATGADRPAVFVDRTTPATATADGDSETHRYLGRMAGNGYHRVEVQFGHDAPGNFLINPKNGRVAFVHSAADVVAPSADGTYVFTFNALNPPASLRVAKLDETGPTLVLVCGARVDDRASRVAFKGGRGDAAFEFVVHVGGVAAKTDVAVRIARDDGAWMAAASDPGRLADAGFSCSAL